VITETPEVSGKIVNLPVMADQYVHKGDLVMEIDPTNYRIAVDRTEAVVAQTKADFDNKRAEETRRLKLTSLAISQEEQQSYTAQSHSAEAIYEQARASLAQAKVDLSRTRIVSPVNGYVTNLLSRKATTPRPGNTPSPSSTATASGSMVISKKPCSLRFELAIPPASH
jgi:multidrug resistance efflux pump